MKCAVIGYGSIGKKHTSVLRELGHSVKVISQREFPEADYKSILDCLSNEEIDYIVIANKTVDHLNTLNSILDSNFKGKILVEKPLFHKKMKFRQVDNVSVAYNLRFFSKVETLLERLKNEKCLSANLYVGQYLPSWRPGTDYKESYSSKRSEGGGVLRDLSHELDLALLMFGNWKKLSCLSGKVSSLELDCEDSVHSIVNFSNCAHCSITLNYLDRQTQRVFTITTDQNTYTLDFVGNQLLINGEELDGPGEVKDSYKKMHEDVLGVNSIACSLSQGLKVLSMIEAMEKSSSDESWERNSESGM